MGTSRKRKTRECRPYSNTSKNRARHSADKRRRRNHGKLPEDLDAIKEFIQHDKNDDYIPLMSAIALKKKKRMLFLPVEFNTVKIDALVDSGAYINAISERDAEKLRQNASQCIVNKAPHPLSTYCTLMPN